MIREDIEPPMEAEQVPDVLPTPSPVAEEAAEDNSVEDPVPVEESDVPGLAVNPDVANIIVPGKRVTVGYVTTPDGQEYGFSQYDVWSSDDHKWERDTYDDGECWSAKDSTHIKERPATPELAAEEYLSQGYLFFPYGLNQISLRWVARCW